MKQCLTCGSTVPDDADVCPDCGMELGDSPAHAATIPAPVAAPLVSNFEPAPVSPSAPASSSGFTVDFGAQDSEAPSAPAVKVDDPFDFESGGTVTLDPPIAPPQAAPSVATAKLTLRRGGVLTGDVFPFGSGAIVGRFDPESGPVDADLAALPESSYVSRHHIEFRHDPATNQWFVKDMGSRNGTFWRAGGQGQFQRVTADQPVASGDEIALGNARFEFQSG